MTNEKAQIINHNNKEVVLVDLSNGTPTDIPLILFAAVEFIRNAPPKSRLVLTDVSNATYNKQVSDEMKEFSTKNTPFVKASAVVGADGVRLILLQTLIFLTRREIKTFTTREAALDWLTSLP